MCANASAPARGAVADSPSFHAQRANSNPQSQEPTSDKRQDTATTGTVPSEKRKNTKTPHTARDLLVTCLTTPPFLLQPPMCLQFLLSRRVPEQWNPYSCPPLIAAVYCSTPSENTSDGPVETFKRNRAESEGPPLMNFRVSFSTVGTCAQPQSSRNTTKTSDTARKFTLRIAKTTDPYTNDEQTGGSDPQAPGKSVRDLFLQGRKASRATPASKHRVLRWLRRETRWSTQDHRWDCVGRWNTPCGPSMPKWISKVATNATNLSQQTGVARVRMEQKSS